MNNNKNKSKKIEPPTKLEPIKWKDILMRRFPHAKVTLSNEFGQLILSEISFDLRYPADWQNMKYFWKELFPRLIPPDMGTEDPESGKKQGSYLG